jgi:alpha-2-macroglobulin
MTTSGASHRASSFRSRRGAPRVLAALAATIVLLVGCASPDPSTAPVPAGTAQPSRPTATREVPGGSADPTASPVSGTEGEWAKLAVADKPAVARLEPTLAGAGGISAATAFRLTSLDGTPPADLAARLHVEPAATLAVASVDGATAILRPETRLRPQTLYRITLLGADGAVAASWAAQTAGPLHVVESIPGDEATQVPVTTGIEIAFDQVGVSTADFARHLRIRPETPGRFEASGRVIAFIPDAPLRIGTLYTVTVTHGLALPGTDQVLARDFVARFETVSTTRPKVQVGFRRSFVESGTATAAGVSLWVDPAGDDDAVPARAFPFSVPVTVHRLAGLRAAERAWLAIEKAPTWTRASRTAAVDTRGLPKVIDRRIRLQGERWNSWIVLPHRLGAGWYVVTVTTNGIPRQTLLQVTDLATYTILGANRSTVWVNDLRTTRAVRGARVTIGGTSLGTTNGQGLVVARTPERVRDSGNAEGSPLLLLVRADGRAAFQPLAASWICSGCDAGASSNPWWQLVSSDRFRYRSSDTINAWGIVRDRATGAVPAALTVDLLAVGFGDTLQVPIATTHATPDKHGAYAVAIPFRDLPAGEYRLVVKAGGGSVGELWLSVGVLSKPAYRLDVSVAHRAAHAGDRVSTSVHAGFFEGTPVAGTELDLAVEEGGSTTASTNADGDASANVLAPQPTSGEQWGVVGIEVTPTLPEEADISASTQLVVFRGSAIVDVSGVANGKHLTITGKVSDAVLARYDDPAVKSLWEVDPRGAARAGATVVVRVTEHYATRHQTGTTYDWITKQVVPTYDYTSHQRTVATRRVITAADGSYRLELGVVRAGRSYDIAAIYTDEGGHRLVAGTSAEGAELRSEVRSPSLTAARGGDDGEGAYSVGDTVRVRFIDGIAKPKADRYLFAVTRLGLRSVTVQDSPVFRTTFHASSVPGFGIRAVRFNGYGYEVAGPYEARVRLSDRRLAVRITTDRDGYAPGDQATITVRTLDPAGRPVAASVFVEVIDEKLFATGDAGISDPLEGLYQSLGDGIILTVASHRTIAEEKGEGGGDTTGGGGEGGDVRGDFRDWLLGRLVTTNASGTATVAVPLSDDLTSWRVAAAAVDGRLYAGMGEASIAVSLPFFAEATVAPEYLVVDRPVVRVRGFGAGLPAGTPVTFTVRSDTLQMAPVTVTAPAFTAAEVPLAPLTAGAHTLRIEATAVTPSGTTVRDALVRTFTVVATRATRVQASWTAVGAGTQVPAGSGATRLLLADAGRGRVLPILEDLAWQGGSRADAAIAADVARRVLSDAFGVVADEPVDGAGLLAFTVDEGWLSLVPYGGADLDVTALDALAGDRRLNAAAAVETLRGVAYAPDQERGRRLLALAGLAGLGQPVLTDVRAAAAQTDLTVPERISLALAALAAGDEELARTLEHGVLADAGVHLGPWTRLTVLAGEDAAVQTARLAIVAASLGEPVAAEMDAWLAANPPRTTTVNLERAIAAKGWAARLPRTAAKAALTVDGTRREVAIDAGTAAEIHLTPAQAASATVDSVTGSVLMVAWRSIPLRPGDLIPARGQVLERSVSPSGTIGETATVVVTLRVTLGPDAGKGCWRVVDFVPSGLAPLTPGSRPVDDEGVRGGVGPDKVSGQRVEFCVAQGTKPVQVVRYVARVVNPGSYAWEPAVLQSWDVPDQGVATPSDSIVIAGAG